MGQHQQVRIWWGGQEAEIDVEIAPLIEKLWHLGIETINSCQDNHGRVWIEFLTFFDAEAFLSLVGVFDHDIGGLYNRIRQEWQWRDGRRLRGRWEYTVRPHDVAVQQTDHPDGIDEQPLGPSAFVFSCSIRFPRRDLPDVVERVRLATRHPEEPGEEV